MIVFLLLQFFFTCFYYCIDCNLFSYNTNNLIHQKILLQNANSKFLTFKKGSYMDVSLKYPRRKSRMIGNTKYQLELPILNTSELMRNLPTSNTSIELILEKSMHEYKINFTKPDYLIKQLEGKPDFIIPNSKIAIFCDGEFWHGKNHQTGSIKNNSIFWDAKIERNIERDKEVNTLLEQANWTVLRFWETDIKNNTENCINQIISTIKSKSDKTIKFTFVDLFSGIGGFRIPLEQLGGKCLGFSEIDKHAIDVYKKNFYSFENDEEVELGNITKLNKLPFQDIDLMVGGVPCQAWSVAGKMKGFEDPRGKLWIDAIRLVKENQPKAFIFENVKGLIDPRNKSSLDLIVQSLRDVGYIINNPQLLNSYDFGLPQNRDRVFIVGLRSDLASNAKPFEYPKASSIKSILNDCIESCDKLLPTKKQFDSKELFGDKLPIGRNRFQKINELNDFFIFCDTRNGHTTIHSWDIIKTTEKEKKICLTILQNRRKKIYGNADGNPLNFSTLKTLINDLKESELNKLIEKKILRFIDGGNGGYEFVNSKNSSGINGIYRVYLPHSNNFSTLTATGTKDMVALKCIEGNSPEEYKTNFINEITKKKLYRPITAREAGRLQGFPDSFVIHNDEQISMKQFGNAVSTPVILNLGVSLISTNIFRRL